MTCPKCESDSLAAVTIDGVEVDQCADCSGIWFDEKELGSLLKHKPSELKPLLGHKGSEALNQQKGRCPRDCADLLRLFSSRDKTLVIDLCPKCRGIWLDGGELDRLVTK